MKRLVVISAIVLLGACSEAPADQIPAAGPEGGPPPLPPYQMRAEMPGGNRLAGAGDAEALFSNRCGSCHLAGGMGTNLITVQQIRAGQPPEMGLLTNREDLTADYVKSVVRMGKVAMPPISRAEVTDAELDKIAGFLGKAD